MATKTYSQLPKTNVLQDSDLVAIERDGIATLAINALDLKNAIRNDLLQNTQSPSTHNIVLMECEHNNGIPVNYPQTLVYLDGSTKYRSDPNPNYAKFIDSIKDNAFYRSLYNIPADNSSFSVKDARNYSFRSAGSLINIGVKQEDGIQKLDLLNKGKVDLDFTLQATGSANNVGALSNFFNNGSNILSSSTTSASQQGVFPSVVPISSIKNLTIDFEKVIIDKNPLLRQNDNETTIKSIGVFAFLDISLGSVGVVVSSGGEVSLPINISDVNGLQDELDLKANITDLGNYATISALDTGLSGKANVIHSHPISEISGLQLALDGKSATIHNHLIGDLKFDSTTSLESWLALTYAPINHTHNISAINGLQTALNLKANTTDLANYLKKDGSVLLDNNYVPSDNLSIATKVYVDNSAPNLSNYLEKGGTYNFTGSLPGIVFTNSTSTTTLFGTGLEVKRNTRRVFLDDSSLIWFDGSPEFNKFSINTFNANFTFKPTSTSPNTIWKMDNREIEDGVLSSAYTNNTIMLKKDISVLLKKRNFNRSWTTTTAGTINGNASVRILDRLAYNPATGIEPLNATFNYTSGTNSFIKELNDVDLPDKILRVILRVKNNAAMGNTQLEFSLFRQSDNTEVGGADNVVINDPDTRGISFELSSRSFGATDSFVLTGYYVVIRNLTPTALAYNNIELLIQVSRDIGY